MNILRFSTTATQQRAGLDAGDLAQVNKALGFLQLNPRHPSLNTHKFSSLCTKAYDVFEAYAQNNTPGALRIFWRYGPDELDAKKKRAAVITILAITPHP